MPTPFVLKILEPQRAQRARREEYGEEKHDRERNEVNVRQLTQGVRRSYRNGCLGRTYLEFSP